MSPRLRPRRCSDRDAEPPTFPEPVAGSDGHSLGRVADPHGDRTAVPEIQQQTQSPAGSHLDPDPQAPRGPRIRFWEATRGGLERLAGTLLADGAGEGGPLGTRRGRGATGAEGAVGRGRAASGREPRPHQQGRRQEGPWGPAGGPPAPVPTGRPGAAAPGHPAPGGAGLGTLGSHDLGALLPPHASTQRCKHYLPPLFWE